MSSEIVEKINWLTNKPVNANQFDQVLQPAASAMEDDWDGSPLVAVADMEVPGIDPPTCEAVLSIWGDPTMDERVWFHWLYAQDRCIGYMDVTAEDVEGL